MYDDRFMIAMTGDETAAFLRRVGPIDGKYSVSPETTSVSWRFLPFHEEQVMLVRVADWGWSVPNLAVYYLSHQSDLYRLNGTSAPIHQVNELARIRITDENVVNYLRFFFWFVRSERGPFVLVEDLPADVNERYRKALEDVVQPALAEREHENKDLFTFGAPVWHSGKLFSVAIEVHPNGMVAMIEEEEIASDFPVGEIERIA